MDLKKETQRNLLIVFGLSIFDKIIIFVGLVILARLLKPQDFGILAIAEILIAFIGLYSSHVFETTAIATSKEDNFDLVLNIAFISRATLSIFLYIIVYILSDFWAAFYNNPELSAITKIMGLNILIAFLYFIPNTALIKERRFDKLVIPRMLKNLLFYGIAVILAVAGFRFWSLVISRLISNIAVAISFFIIRPWKVKLSWDKNIFFNMLRYMKNMYIFLFLVFFIAQIDRFAVSKILGVAFVGYYAMAYSFGNLLFINIFAICDTVAFPLYSKVKDDVNLLKTIYLKFLKYILFISVPLLTILVLFGKHFVLLFLGAKWSIIVTPLKILCFVGFLGLIGNVSNSLLKSINRLDIEVKRNSLLTAAILITIIPLTMRYGLIGSCISMLISFALVQPIYFNYAIETINLNKRKVAMFFLMFFGSSLCGIIFYIFCDKLFLNNIRWTLLRFGLSILIYAGTYLAIIFPLMRDELIADIKSLLTR